MLYEEDQVTWEELGLGTWFGKMSLEPSAPTKDKTSQPSLKKLSKSQSRKLPLFLYLKKDGQQADALWETNGALLGEFSMHSFGEHPISLYHRGVGESHLSQILEANPHPKYSLSAKACQGILNRASRRGKKLPEMLEKALLEQAESTVAKTLDALNCGYPACNQGGTAVVEQVYTINQQGGNNDQIFAEMAGTLTAATMSSGNNKLAVAQPICIEMTSTKNTIIEDGVCPTLTARMGTGGNQVNAVMETYQQVTGPLMANSHPGSYTSQDAFSDMLVVGADLYNQAITGDVAKPLTASATDSDHTPVVIEPIALDRAFFNQGVNAQYNPQFYEDGSNPTRVSRGPSAVCARHIVRRLTPLECERLQGYPDHWTNIGEWVDSKGKKHREADAPRYKALGNSIALPPWKWVLKRLCACYERDATMASLFDGIGGFPLIWEQLNGKGSCLWASEIEEFPIAVTKLRFGEG